MLYTLNAADQQAVLDVLRDYGPPPPGGWRLTAIHDLGDGTTCDLYMEMRGRKLQGTIKIVSGASGILCQDLPIPGACDAVRVVSKGGVGTVLLDLHPAPSPFPGVV